MNGVIFGSGIIGLIAKRLLGWKIIPFKRSRFYSFSPALDDNYIIRDDRIDQAIKDISGQSELPIYLYKRAWSFGGELFKQFDNDLCSDWLQKVFGSEIPSHSLAYISQRMQYSTYNIKVNELYKLLMSQYIDELRTESANGDVTEIGDHYFIRNGNRYDFDHAISAIPLKSLCELTKHNIDTNYRTIHYIHLRSNKLDFEGCSQILVVDKQIDFFKVSNIAQNHYLFYCSGDIRDPGLYFMQIADDIDILDGTSIEEAIPIGNMPNLDVFEKLGIYCVGASAQHDWCCDIGSSLVRLLRYSQDGYKQTVKRFRLV